MQIISCANTIQDLKHLQARLAALSRGIQTHPENAIDYGEALEVQLFLLSEVIQHLYQQELDNGDQDKK
jgi:hypothetical protein